ncbi:MAG: GNAT family N-acetyltransferase [Candidatus Hodarchaeales archaeon]|jgi:ribosomal protein S18 acetylase RimI-like enzyme
MTFIKGINRYIISISPSEEQMKIVEKGLEDHNKKFPSGELDIPTPDISLVLRDPHGNIIGGVITSMLTGIMHLEVLWIEENYRGRGLGKALVLQAEKIGRAKGYPASQTWTFSFQSPNFYQRIGYKVVGIFDGYTEGITEYVLLKNFRTDHLISHEDIEMEVGFSISEDASEASMKILNDGLRKYVKMHVGEIRSKNRGIKIEIVVRKEGVRIIGGLMAYTTLKAVHIVQIWVHESYRNQGHGKELLETAEAIAVEHGCISGLINVLSFQSPEFFRNHGYKVFGVSDGYPDSIKEYFLKKKVLDK